MRFHRLYWTGGCLFGWLVAGCSDSATILYRSEGTPGELTVALGLSSGLDVTSVRVDIVSASEGCDGTVIATQTVSTFGEGPVDAGDVLHPTADARFVLPEGEVRVCATPLSGDAPSPACSPAEALAGVIAGETRDVSLLSQCTSPDTGALQATVAFNSAPSIDSLALDPGDDISTCESTLISVTASDPEGDALSYAWSADGGRLRSEASSATFSAPAAADFVVNVEVTDTHGGKTDLNVPVHVSAAVCAVAPEVHQIILARCSPCHTTGNSGGLKMDTAENAYANLVGQPARGNGCTNRTRVIPGDAAASYLIAKLRGEAGICGLRMPRNLPPLPEGEIQTIEGWINGLPH